MPALETIPIPLGFKAKAFSLPEVVSGKPVTLSDIKGERATVLMFICNHCPYVKHVLPELIALGNDYKAKGVNLIAISSNDVSRYPDDSPDKMQDLAVSMNFPFPYLYDESQDVARAYQAACTPDFAVFDSQLVCVYRGRLDESTPGNGKPLTGADMRKVLDKIVNGESLDGSQYPSIGCSIKWKE
ncbi:MAG: thioredoxin family protein [Flavobacteriales bacterium]|nr:thioredoxin family protein [Flavobacteriales bacterium]